VSPSANPLRQLRELGQSVWLDDLNERLLRSGELARLIADDGVSGVTSNPTILQKAIVENPGYVTEIRRQDAAGGSVAQICENLMVALAQRAADALRRVHTLAGGQDGFVSLEVPPTLADDTAATIAAGRRLWLAIDRPNAMIKVPATAAGLPAVQRLIAEGINVNVTLLFGVLRYRQVLQAVAAGLDERRVAGGSLAGVASVASVFVSRIDTLVDAALEQAAGRAGNEAARELRGRAGTEVARFIYQDFRKFSATPHWQSLAAHGARVQRPLWASTSTKNPAYSDVRYVDALVGPDTVTTIPLETLELYRDHGRPGLTLESNLYDAATLPAELQRYGIDLDRVSEQLERQGIQKFAASYQALLADLAIFCGPRPTDTT
jgi:transaldolase